MTTYEPKHRFANIGSHFTWGSDYEFGPELCRESMETDRPIYQARYGGDGDSKKIEQSLIELGARFVRQYNEYRKAFVWPDKSYVDLSKNDSNFVTLDWSTINEDLHKKLTKISRTLKEATKTKGRIFAVVQGHEGPELRSVGEATVPLVEGNYHPKIVQDFNYVLESFRKNPPQGRVVILNGEPGTGKTHLIRAMIGSLESVFVNVPGSMLDGLDKPGFVPMLLNAREEYGKERPITLIIEDGDNVLVQRGSDNLSGVAALLNLSDGILGSMLDIRIVISSNAEIKDIDKAILRPGRLCRQINVGRLEYNQACEIFGRLGGQGIPPVGSYTLAEIYDAAHGGQAAPAKRRMGF